MILQNGCVTFEKHPFLGSSLSAEAPAFGIVTIFRLTHSPQRAVIIHEGLCLHPLMDDGVEHIFMYYFVFCASFW